MQGFFQCKICAFKSSRKSNFDTHLLTLKHKIRSDTNEKNANIKFFACECSRSYKHQSSLWNHRKLCSYKEDSQNEQNNNLHSNTLSQSEMFKQFTQMVKEIVVEQTVALSNHVSHSNQTQFNINNHNSTLTNTNNNNNSHNKTFNLQFFLTHTCKDAMNISDFINSIDLQVNDFEEVGEKGFVNGISSIIIKKLNALDEHMRPVHCSDLKRESVYIKENNQWKKDTNNNEGLKKVIKAVAYKNTALSPAFKAKYPDYGISTSKSSDRYNRAMIESHGGSGNNDETNLDKIVKRITKEILISKE